MSSIGWSVSYLLARGVERIYLDRGWKGLLLVGFLVFFVFPILITIGVAYGASVIFGMALVVAIFGWWLNDNLWDNDYNDSSARVTLGTFLDPPTMLPTRSRVSAKTYFRKTAVGLGILTIVYMIHPVVALFGIVLNLWLRAQGWQGRYATIPFVIWSVFYTMGVDSGGVLFASAIVAGLFGKKMEEGAYSDMAAYSQWMNGSCQSRSAQQAGESGTSESQQDTTQNPSGHPPDAGHGPSNTDTQDPHSSSTMSDARENQGSPDQNLRDDRPSDEHVERTQASDSADRGEGVDDFEFDWDQPPNLTMEEIGGYEDVKSELSQGVLEPAMSDGESFERFGVEPTKGVLFHGPPGTGKTMFARALAGHLGRPFLEVTQADLSSKWVNEGPDRIQQVFEEAEAINGVLLIDEAEQLLQNRGNNLGNNEDDKLTNQFLSMLSIEDRNSIVILTTNRMDLMDDAVLRSGRIDDQYYIGEPDFDARKEIFEVKLAPWPHTFTDEDIERMASRTDGKTGADIDAIVRDARERAANQGAARLSWDHFEL